MDTTRAGVSRRRLLQLGSAGVGTVLVGRPGAASAGSVPRWLRRGSWSPLVGRPVTLRGSGQLALVAARDLRGRSPGGVLLPARDDAFELVFAHDPAVPVAQGVYGLAPADLGRFEALVVPERPGRCTVVVNRTP